MDSGNRVLAPSARGQEVPHVTARVDDETCLGCGVCHVACKNKAVSMQARPKRVFTPENNIERLVRATVERGTIHHMLFDDPGSVTSRGMNLARGALLHLPITRRLLAVEQIKSTFVRTIVSGAQRQMDAAAGNAPTRCASCGPASSGP